MFLVRSLSSSCKYIVCLFMFIHLFVYFCHLVINKNQTSDIKKKKKEANCHNGTKQMLDFCVTESFGFYC